MAAAPAHLQKVLRLAPKLPELHFAFAFAYGKLGAHAQAIDAYRRAITLRPAFASAWLNLGVELIADGRDYLAAPCYRQALAALSSNHPADLSTRISAYINLGHLARSRRRFPQAREHYAEALALAVTHAPQRVSEAHLAFACLHIDQRHFAEARQSLALAEETQSASAPNPEIPNTRGILLLAEHSAAPNPEPYAQLIEQAISAFRQAESLGHKTAASNRGNALLRLGRCEEALAAHHAALALSPHHPGIRYNLALTQLRLGDFTRGWPSYEVRWSFREVHPRPRRFRQPRWQGESLNPSATLFLYAEQGLGDTIQFVRYLPPVARRLPGIPLILEVQPPLARLLQPFVASLGIPARLISQGEPIPHFTHHCPLMSLPAIFQTTLETIPTQIPYLSAPSTEKACPPERPGSPRSGLCFVERNCEASAVSIPCSLVSAPCVGLAWSGNPSYRADHERSTRLQTFLPLLRLPNIRWISLQKGPAAAQIAEIPPQFRPRDAASSDRDLADAAATIAGLDLVLATDTAIAHLAGALGKPLWLLLPWQSDWRWMQHRPDTPWYPAARLFRQSSPGNWPELIRRVAAELSTFLAQRTKQEKRPRRRGAFYR